MPTTYSVSLLTKRISAEPQNLYADAVLNSIFNETELTGNLTIAAMNAPAGNIRKFYNSGASSYLNGLPTIQYKHQNPADLVKLEEQMSIDWGLPLNQIEILDGEILDVIDLPFEAIMRATLCNHTLDDDGLPIGLVEAITDTPDLTAHHVRDDGLDVMLRVVDNENVDISNYQSHYMVRTLVGDPDSATNTYDYTAQPYFDFMEHQDYQDATPDPIPVLHLTNGYFEKVVYRRFQACIFTWINTDYPDEIIYDIRMLSGIWYASGLHEIEEDTPFGTGYPIIPLRKDGAWVNSYEPQSTIDNYNRTFNTLNYGDIEGFIDAMDGEDGIVDIDDIFITQGVDLYSHISVDNQYMYLFFKHILDSPQFDLNPNMGVTDFNNFDVYEGDFNQFFAFRGIEHTVIVSDVGVPVDTRWRYDHVWAVDPAWDGVSPMVYANPDVTNEFNPNKDISLHQYVVRRFHPDTDVLYDEIRVNGVISSSRLYFDASDSYMWSHTVANPATEVLVQAQHDVEANGDEYLGTQGTPFVITMLYEVLNYNFMGKEANDLASNSLFLQLYGSQITHVSWWKKAVAFILKVWSFVITIFNIVTLGLNLITMAAAQALSYLAYQVGLYFIKKAIVDILIEKIGAKYTFLAQALATYFNIPLLSTNIDFNDLFDLVKFTMSVVKADLIDKHKALENLTKDDIDASEQILENENNLKDVILNETYDDFVQRTTDVSILVQLPEVSLMPEEVTLKHTFTEDALVIADEILKLETIEV